ncbi:hypothetical protein Drorol1_Dr00010847 [Drosera rotundifolia]
MRETHCIDISHHVPTPSPSIPNSTIHVYRRLLEDGLERDVFIGTRLIDFWCKMGRVERARNVFDEMLEKDVVVWNVMIAGLAQGERVGDAVGLFRRMWDEGMVPNSVTLLNVFPAMCRLEDERMCRSIHGFALVEHSSKS